jgi:hypothetical protein
MKGAIFAVVELCSLLKLYGHFVGIHHRHLQSRRLMQAASKKQTVADCLDYSSYLKMEAVRSFETSMNFYQITLCHVQEHCIHIL